MYYSKKQTKHNQKMLRVMRNTGTSLVLLENDPDLIEIELDPAWIDNHGETFDRIPPKRHPIETATESAGRIIMDWQNTLKDKINNISQTIWNDPHLLETIIPYAKALLNCGTWYVPPEQLLQLLDREHHYLSYKLYLHKIFEILEERRREVFCCAKECLPNFSDDDIFAGVNIASNFWNRTKEMKLLLTITVNYKKRMEYHIKNIVVAGGLLKRAVFSEHFSDIFMSVHQ
jgi:hypothetical protein